MRKSEVVKSSIITKLMTSLNPYQRSVISLVILVFLGKSLSKEASGSNIGLEELQESTNEEPLVKTNTQPEDETPIEETHISPPLCKSSRVSHFPGFYVFHITESNTLISSKKLLGEDE
ncbi:hypothetical protein L2E82_50072 [Cichorium intybus]|nr:hypothetical protein L2E82_50072 [Cichorium intybus]